MLNFYLYTFDMLAYKLWFYIFALCIHFELQIFAFHNTEQ